jgi:DNA-binding NtrC family response regulator
VVFGGERGLTFSHLGLATSTGAAGSPGWMRSDFVFPENGFSLEAAIDEMVGHALKQAGGNVSAAARLLGVSRDVVRYRLKGANREAEKVGE